MTSGFGGEDRVRRAMMQQLQSLQRAGVTHIVRTSSPSAEYDGPPRPTVSSSKPPVASPKVATVPAATRPPGGSLFDSEPMPQRLSLEQRTAQLHLLQQQVAACTACEQLACTRTQTVFGVGDPQARLCFLGEAPGADEDRLGEPFVGKAGQLLDKIIAACGMTRQQVYILNVLKCRPPGNRNPEPDEVLNCRGYFEQQLELIRPQFICCLGAVAAHALLDTSVAVGQLRGRIHNYRGIKVVVTYHPSYLLRNPAAKRPAWDDMKMLLAEMGLPVPP